MSGTHTIYTDDTDPYVEFTVTDRLGGDLDWATPTVAVGPGEYELVATWQGSAGSSRVLRVPVDSLPVGPRNLYLRVPGGNDIRLGSVLIATRR